MDFFFLISNVGQLIIYQKLAAAGCKCGRTWRTDLTRLRFTVRAVQLCLWNCCETSLTETKQRGSSDSFFTLPPQLNVPTKQCQIIYSGHTSSNFQLHGSSHRSVKTPGASQVTAKFLSVCHTACNHSPDSFRPGSLSSLLSNWSLLCLGGGCGVNLC